MSFSDKILSAHCDICMHCGFTWVARAAVVTIVFVAIIQGGTHCILNENHIMNVLFGSRNSINVHRKCVTIQLPQ